jgi:hypothetical protein
MALIDFIEDALPGWMLHDDLLHWRDLAGAIAIVWDALIEGAIEGLDASMPGQVEGDSTSFPSVDALPYIGRDRRIVRGLAETTASYAGALRGWRKAHALEGTAFELLAQLQRILGPDPPRVRLVNSFGSWHTIEADGTRKMHVFDEPGFQIAPDGTTSLISTMAHPWDWDGTYDPFYIWPIIYAPNTLISEGVDWGDPGVDWGDEGLVWGMGASIALVEMIRGLIRDWMPAGIVCKKIIVAFDDASFDPETPGPYPAAGMPDGTWGSAWKLSGGVYVPSRLSTARYLEGIS